MAKKIKIYTTNTCAYCDAVKQLLDKKGLTYQIVNIDEQPEKRAEMAQYTTMATVPVVVVSDDQDETAPPRIVQGWNPAALSGAVA